MPEILINFFLICIVICIEITLNKIEWKKKKGEKQPHTDDGDDKELILYMKQCLMDVWAKRTRMKK